MVQLQGLNVLNLLLSQAPTAACHGALAAGPHLMQACLGLLQPPNLEASRAEEARRKLFVAAKALLCLGLLLPHAHALLAEACEQELLTSFPKVGVAAATVEAKDGELKQYAARCQGVLRDGIITAVPAILQAVRSSPALAACVRFMACHPRTAG